MIVRSDIVGIADQENTFALAHVLRLDDVGLVLQGPVVGFALIVSAFHGSCVLLKLDFELIVFHWQDERFGEKVVFIRELLLHFHQVARQLALVRNHSDARELRYPLVRFDLCQGLWRYRIVKPCNIEVRSVPRIVGPIDCPIVVVVSYGGWQQLDVFTFAS